MPCLLVNSDHDRTLIKGVSYDLAVQLNSRANPAKAIAGLLAGREIPERAFGQYLEAKGKREFGTLKEISDFLVWAYFEKLISKASAVAMAQDLLKGMPSSDFKHCESAVERELTPGAIEYARMLTQAGFVHVILSDGLKPIVVATANIFRDSGAEVYVVYGSAPVFEHGRLVSINLNDKWKYAFGLYDRLAFAPSGSGIYSDAVSVDDSAANIPAMKRHGLAIAFCPTPKDKVLFAEAGGFVIQEERNIVPVARRIIEFSSTSP